MRCKICNENSNLILSLDSGLAVSSLGKVLNANAEIFLCSNCSHCQTIPSINLFEYYSKEYKTLSVSFDEDDLYGYENDIPVYRNSYMAKSPIKKSVEFADLNILNGPILDFGCGKSLVMKHLMEMTQKEDVFLFDVSKDYIKFWDTFIPANHYSCYDLPEKWNGYFNLITSFFSLEHVNEPLTDLKRIHQLLKESGYVYIIVPNMYSENIADMLVIDHIQHYSESSMHLLFMLCGFEMIEADHHTHAQGSIYLARAISNKPNTYDLSVESEVSRKECIKVAQFWKEINASIRKFEMDMEGKGVNTYYIIGAGFMGTYIYLQLQYPERLAGFIDSNEHKQKKGWQGKEVFAPGMVRGDINNAVLCGFNRIQIQTLLAGMLPIGLPNSHIWTMNK